MILHTNLVLSRNPNVSIEAFGIVVWASPFYRDEGTRYCLGVRFVDLDSESRERIITYVFQQQRGVLRRRKEGLQNGEQQ